VKNEPEVHPDPAARRAPVVVLKLGSSVLRSEGDLHAVAQALTAERARGASVVAVVSAFAGATDRLLARARRLCPSASPGSLARLLATGEARAAASLALALEGGGLPVRLLDPGDGTLVASGPPLEAEPRALDPTPFDAAFGDRSLVVLPGFYARGERGGTVLLGRGGTDLSALFVATRLGAECRLVKDTGGVFDADPHRVAGARRFAQLAWDDARRLGARVVQDRALAFARRERLAFSVSSLCGNVATRVGPGPSRFAAGPAQREAAISPTAETRRATSSGVV